MQVRLIAASAGRQAFLSSMIDSIEGLALSTQVRDPATGWHQSVSLESLDLVILDSPAGAQHQDLVLLNQWVTRRPALGVLLLTDDIDPAFLLQAMRSGVREVLRLQPNKTDLLDALTRLQQHVRSFASLALRNVEPDTTQGRLIAFVPSKGGCGATFLATNIAYLLAKEYQRDNLLMDLDLHGADASYYLSGDEHRNSLLDLTRHLDRLDSHLLHSSLHPVIPSLFLLAAPHVNELTSTVTPDQLDHVLRLARQQYGLVLLDLPVALDALSAQALDMADEVYLVLSNTVPDVRNAKRWRAMWRSLGHTDDKLRIVLNKTHPGSDIDATKVRSALNLDVRHDLPGDPTTALQAINQGLPLVSVNPHSPLVQALHALITQEWQLTTTKRKSWLERWF